jgi:signal transduction histidine kinase
VIDNAQVHAFDGRSSGKITVSAESDRAGSVVLKIQDDGRGIPEQNLEKVFDPFYTTRMGSGSLGLGLNIAHNVVVGILGGKIKVGSEHNRGTLVTITLPMVAPHLRKTAMESMG